MKEYGGYLSFEQYYGNEYHNGVKLDSVRSALAYIINKRSYTHVYIPYYMCDCIYKLISKLGIDYTFYNIDTRFKPEIKNKKDKNSLYFICNFYGQLTDKNIMDFRKEFSNIFLDNTQTFFSMPLNGIDTAYTCRKYFGVTGGSYLYTDLDTDDLSSYAIDTAFDKASITIGRLEKGASLFYDEFQKNEERLRGIPIKRMSLFDANIMKSIDYEKIITIRKNNFIFLNKQLKAKNQLNIKNFAGLFMYPLLIDNGAEIKEKLISRKVYIPTLWPGVSEFDGINNFEKDLANNLVLLPIDQRYNRKDMCYILSIIKEYF